MPNPPGHSDHEIFDLVSELESTEGKGTTFYKFLEIDSSASAGDLGRAYRKRSLELQ
jgi:DnaJ homolog subfamily C member 1